MRSEGGQVVERVGSAVSVVITCYNQARFLGEAITSVLGQSCAPGEVLVIDDGSKDDTAEVVARYPVVHYLPQANQGVVAARNNGWRKSTGDYIVLLDGDDRLLPHALEVGLKSLQSSDGCGFAYGRCGQIDAAGEPLPHTSPAPAGEDHYAALLRSNDIWMPGQVMFRRATLEMLGGFDAEFDHGSDHDLYLRIARSYPVHSHDQVVAEWRQHNTNTTRDAERMLKSSVMTHRAQREFVKANKRYEQAYREGARKVREYYGERVVSNILADIGAGGDRKRVLKSATLLLRYSPSVFLRHARRKLYRTLFNVKSKHEEEVV